MDSQDSPLDPPSPAEPVPLAQVAVHLDPLDNVAIAKVELPAGVTLLLGDRADVSLPSRLRLPQTIPSGHKVALQPIAAGEPVLRYGQEIGLATRAIRPGEHVHIHNLGIEGLESRRAHDVRPPAATELRPLSPLLQGEPQIFLGYKRPDGRVGTRNYIAVISTVNCSAHVTRAIAGHFTAERLAGFPRVDGVVAFTHHLGCTYRVGSRDEELLQRTLAGIARHPNVGAYLLVGLGCETNQIEDLAERCGLRIPEGQGLVIQELGGIRKTVEAGIAAIEALLPEVNRAQRTPQPVSELMVALQCGGSDGWSGVTANPAVGLVSDELVRQGGTVVLAETPEIYGAEHLLLRRAARPDVGEKLLAQVQWWEEHARNLGMDVDDNRSVGNAAGGLTTIYEKSLGAMAKAGSTPLMEVYDYAEPVVARGFVFMNSPGYDPVSVTGQVAGGCNLVLFTTGRGSVCGFKPAPVIKIASNSATYECIIDDMDLNAGRVLDGASLEEVAAELLEKVVAVASGQPSKSEAQGVGEAEFSPWFLGGML
jgi:altronate dehydratase